MISIGHGERIRTLAGNCTTPSLADMNLSVITAEDPCEMIPVVTSPQSYRGLLNQMVQQSHLPPSKRTEQVVRMEAMVGAVLLLMLVEGAAILSEE